ncbi:MAG: ATP-binding protein [Armatimonadota bacterium]
MTSGRGMNDPPIAHDDLAAADRLSIIDGLLEISEAIISEKELSSALQMARAAFLQLEKEKTNIEAVLAQLGDGVVVSDARNRVIMVNSAAEKIIGLAHEDVLGMSLMDIYPKPFRVEVRMVLEQLSCSKPAAGLFWEQNISLPGGKVIRANMRPVFLKSGVFVGIASLLQDITETVALDEAKKEFISTVAHELRTPLTSLKGSLGLVLGGAVGEIDPGLREMLGIAENSCNKLIRLVDDMLDIAKIEAGYLGLEMDIISVQDRVKSAVDRMRQFANERQVNLSVKVTGRQRKVIGDGDRIEQVVINLLSNAIKFSPAGASIEVTVGRTGSCVKVSVTDHGPGIAPTEQKKIFEKFYRAAGQDQPRTNGSGLGLPISKGIIEQHGGKISVKSAPGKGSTFSFVLSIPGEEPCLSNE